MKNFGTLLYTVILAVAVIGVTAYNTNIITIGEAGGLVVISLVYLFVFITINKILLFLQALKEEEED